MIAVGIISFTMFRFAGDPVNQIVSLDTPAAERAAVRKSLGLDDPVPCSSRAISSMPRSSSSASPINSVSRSPTC